MVPVLILKKTKSRAARALAGRKARARTCDAMRRASTDSPTQLHRQVTIRLAQREVVRLAKRIAEIEASAGLLRTQIDNLLTWLFRQR
jgi:hypothetical protein